MAAGMPRPGQLRHRLELQLATKERLPSGGVRKVWGTAAVLPASVEPLQGRELRDAKQVDGRITHRVVLRWHPDVSRSCRLKLEKPGREPRLFYPVSVLNLEERDTWLQLQVEERVRES